MLFSTTVIAVVRPLTPDDPCLVKDEQGYIYPRLLQAMQQAELVSDVIISVPDSVPQSAKDILVRWPFAIRYSKEEFPQHRIGEILAEQQLSHAVILDAYGYLIEGEALSQAVTLVKNGQCDLVMPEAVISAKFFAVLNHKTAEHFAEFSDYAVPLSRFEQQLGRRPHDLKVIKIKTKQSSAEGFLWDGFYAGTRSIIPRELLISFFSSTDRRDWFRPESSARFLGRALDCHDWSWLEERLQHIATPKLQLSVTTALHWLRRLRDHLPAERTCCLEIGFGIAPSVSYLLALVFEKALAIEPFAANAATFSQAADLIALLAERMPSVIPLQSTQFTSDSRTIFDRTEPYQDFLENLHLPDCSVDFCHSKCVFEHILDVAKLSREIHRVLKPGGVMIHEIGFNDHRFGDGLIIHFNYLEFSRREWEENNTDPASFTSIWRITDHLQLWNDLGFETEILSRENTRLFPEKIHPSWAGYGLDDLLCHTAVIKGIKRGEQ